MGLSDGKWLVCPQCSVSNGPWRRSCFVCGHGLEAARPEPGPEASKSPTSPTSPELVNPYEAPTTVFSLARAFGISSALMVLAVIAVFLGVAHENGNLGIFLAVAVAPPLVYTIVVAAKSRVRGTPMAVLEKVGTFLAALTGVVVIAVSAFIAFCVSCFSSFFVFRANLDNFNIVAASCVPALAAAAYMTYYLLYRKGRRRGSPGKP